MDIWDRHWEFVPVEPCCTQDKRGFEPYLRVCVAPRTKDVITHWRSGGGVEGTGWWQCSRPWCLRVSCGDASMWPRPFLRADESCPWATMPENARQICPDVKTARWFVPLLSFGKGACGMKTFRLDPGFVPFCPTCFYDHQSSPIEIEVWPTGLDRFTRTNRYK